MYGVLSKDDIKKTAEIVVKILGGGENAVKLLLETCAAETLMGTYRNKIQYNYGLGLCQFDKIAFLNVQQKTSLTKKELIIKWFNIDIDKVEYRELAYSPLLSMIWCRLYYLLVPSVIPSTLEGRAEYWKKYYNSVLGSGTVEEYIKKSKFIEE